jgi:hypothetical protein
MHFNKGSLAFPVTRSNGRLSFALGMFAMRVFQLALPTYLPVASLQWD